MAGMSGRRETKKALRRTAILDAALSLLNRYPGDEMTIEQIATKANVSHATVFNLVGTRQELMYALLERQMVSQSDLLRARIDDLLVDPIQGAIDVVECSVDALTAESRAFKQIIAEIAGGAMPLDKTAQVQLVTRCLSDAQAAGLLDPAYNPVGLSRRVFAAFAIAVMSWVSDLIDDAGFKLAARHGLFTVFAAVAADQHRDRFRDELIELTERYAVFTPVGSAVGVG
jgi:AcrR family transcriptional regulator